MGAPSCAAAGIFEWLIIAGNEEVFEILYSFPFTSESKRMGIIIREESTGQHYFYLKGADTVMERFIVPSDWLEEEVGGCSDGMPHELA